MKKEDLNVVKKDKNLPYINRFCEICNSFFFPLLYPIRNERELFIKETQLLSSLTQLLSVFI
jgi:hypothetical protein